MFAGAAFWQKHQWRQELVLLGATENQEALLIFSIETSIHETIFLCNLFNSHNIAAIGFKCY